MSTQTILIIVAVILVVVLAAAGLRSGPRVTQIDRTVKREEEGEER